MLASHCLASAAGDWLAGWADPAAVERVGWVLLHFLWQGSAAAALLAVALTLLRDRPAVVRYRAACAALLVLVAAPVATLWIVRPIHAVATGGDAVRITRPEPAAGRPIGRYLGPVPADAAAMADRLHRSAASASDPAAPPPTFAADWPASAWTWVVGGWAAGVIGLSAWRVGGWLHLRRLVRRTTPAAAPWPDRLAALAGRLGVRAPVRLAEAAWVAGPAVVGLLRPVVLLPAAALTGLTPTQLEAILAHELAHVRRRDYLVNLLQAAAETVLFYHPAVWWVSARIREEREHCCDDLAVTACAREAGSEAGDVGAGFGPADYAEALAAAERLRLDRPPAALPAYLALAAAGTRAGRRGGAGDNGLLLRRVRRVLGVPPPAARRVGARPLAAAAAALACAAVPLVAARADKEPSASGTPRLGVSTSAPSAIQPSPTTAGTTVSPATAPSTAPATAPDDPFASARPPEPWDLTVVRADYQIGPNDLLTITIGELRGPGTETIKTTRVSESGTISLPFIGEIKVAGQTEAELERAIIKVYRDKRILEMPPVSARVTEARGRTFSVIGGVPQPGQYSIPDADFRLLDALALTKADVTTLDIVYVMRKAATQATADELGLVIRSLRAQLGPNHPSVRTRERELEEVRAEVERHRPRTIAVPAGPLSAGDTRLNVVVRPGDMVVARGGSQGPERLVVDADGTLRFRGERATWADLPDRLAKVPAAERARATLLVAPASDQMTIRQLLDAEQRATALGKEYGFREVKVSTAPPPPATSPTSGPAGRAP